MKKKILLLWSTFKIQILTKKRILLVLLFAFVYIALAVFILNYKLVLATIFGNFTIGYKISVLFSLLTGITNTLAGLDFTFFMVGSFFGALNVVTAIIIINHMKRRGLLKIIVGGGEMLGIASTGCSSCGFSLMSILGFGPTLSFIPFGNYISYILSTAIFFLTFIYMLGKLHKSASCQTKNL